MIADFQSLEPGLQKALATCNNETGIAETYQEFQAEQEAMTPEQAEERNKVMVGLFGCLDRRGWTVGEFRPDENGLLQFTSAPEAPPNADEAKDFSDAGSRQPRRPALTSDTLDPMAPPPPDAPPAGRGVAAGGVDAGAQEAGARSPSSPP